MEQCQGCGRVVDGWLVKTASVSVGKIYDWKLRLCDDCTERLAIGLGEWLQRPDGYWVLQFVSPGDLRARIEQLRKCAVRTRDIVADSAVGVGVRFGPNPEWVKLDDVERLLGGENHGKV